MCDTVEDRDGAMAAAETIRPDSNLIGGDAMTTFSLYVSLSDPPRHRYVAFSALIVALLFLPHPSNAQTLEVSSSYIDADGRTQVAAELDPVNGSPLWIYDVDSLTFISSESAIPTSASAVLAVAENFLIRYDDLLKLGGIDLGEPSVRETPSFWTVEWEQQVGSAMVHGSYVALTVTKQGRLLALGSRVFPAAMSSSALNSMARSLAHSAVAARLGVMVSSVDIESDAVLLPELADGDSYSFRPAYRVRAGSEEVGGGIGLVDAITGEVIRFERISVSPVDQPFGHVAAHRTSGDNTPALHAVDLVDPVASDGGTNGVSGYVTLNYHTSPPDIFDHLDRHYNQQFKGARVDIQKVGGGWSTTVYANESGYYSATGMPSGSYEITFRLANDKAHIHSGVFTSWLSETVGKSIVGMVQEDYDWEWGKGGDRDQSGSAYALVAVTHLRQAYKYFKDGLGVSGVEELVQSMPIKIDTVYHDGWTSINALVMVGREYALSGDVTLHEYGHNAIYKMYDDKLIQSYAGSEADPWANTLEAKAMDEGFADYFAADLTDDSVFGGPVKEAEEPSFRDTMSVTVRFMWNTATMDDFFTLPNEHKRGQIIAGANWRLRLDIGNEINFLTRDAMYMVPRAQSFKGYRRNLAVADVYRNSGSNLDDIENRFVERKIGGPNPPTSLSVTDTGTATLLSWNDKSVVEENYVPEVSANGGAWWPVTTLSPNTTSYYDDWRKCNGVTYQYRIRVTANGVDSYSPVRNFDPCLPDPKTGELADAEVEAFDRVPERFDVEVYPMPFRSSTAARISMPDDGDVEIVVYDLSGRTVYRNRVALSTGYSEIRIPGEGLAQGMYVYSVQTSADIRKGKLVKVR